MTPQSQPRTLHGTADDDSRPSREKTTMPPDPGPVRSITRGKAESSQRTESKESRARKRQESEQEPRTRANRALVLDAGSRPLMRCTPRRARKYCDRCRRLTAAQRRKVIAKPNETIKATARTGEEPGAAAEGDSEDRGNRSREKQEETWYSSKSRKRAIPGC